MWKDAHAIIESMDGTTRCCREYSCGTVLIQPQTSRCGVIQFLSQLILVYSYDCGLLRATKPRGGGLLDPLNHSTTVGTGRDPFKSRCQNDNDAPI